ncbi:hypothetical protein [Actinomyces ruminis]|uniref:ABC-2 type transport system permease protein n=1 Tax=Actinomyces ruminis TaxID=1937003 RepID=A0ABX4MDJ8_9ACTO|nr:hypothetical protein [Actinomyces ruminis]PHP52162.1 hypothetical protein BW737_011465 [Actinomyces ruminis]
MTPHLASRRVIRTARLLAREERAWLVTLPAAVALLTCLLAPGYATTYATAADLARAVAGLRMSKTTAALYGELPADADVVQLGVWELGALTCLLLGIVVVLRAVAVSRAQEDSGRSELLRGAGTGPVGELAASCLVLAAHCLLLGVCAGAGMAALDGANRADALAYGAAVCGTCALLGAVTLLLAQFTADATGARGAGLAALGLLYAGHGAWAAEGWAWAGAWSPFALRSAIDPGGKNDWRPLLVAGAALLVLLAAAAAAVHRRDLGAGLIRIELRRRRPLRVRGPVTLALRLVRVQLLAWAVATAAIAGVLTAMGENMVDFARKGAVDGGVLGSQLGGGDPGAGFLGYIGVLAAAMACAQAVVLAGRFAAEEQSGLVEAVRGTGAGPARLVASWCLVALLATALTLGATALVSGLVGARLLETTASDALRLVAGQWPATAASAGIAALLGGLLPQARWLAWVPLLAGLGIAQLGPSLNLPRSVIDAGLFAQAGKGASTWLLLIGVVGVALGAVAAHHRDLRPSGGRQPSSVRAPLRR